MFILLFKESLSFAWHALVTNKLRSFLSLLGITIGIFAIISVFTVVDSLENNLRKSVTSLGNNVIFVQRWPWEFNPNVEWWKIINYPAPNLDDLEEVKLRCKGAEAAAYVVTGHRTIKFKNSSIENVEIIAASHDYDKVRNFELREGRYFSEKESKSGENHCLIGSLIADVLFPGTDAIGQTIKIGGSKVNIIGVFKQEGESMIGNSLDKIVLVSVNYVRNLVDLRSEGLEPTIMVKSKAGVSNEELIDELRGIMRSVRKLKPVAENNFSLNQTTLLTSQLDGMFSIIGLAGWIIGGFSILVGGFGIANIMFVSVKERTTLIGIQKSLGAKNYFILMQFLVESILLCIIGGLIGLLIIYLMTFAVGDSFGMEIVLTESNVVLGFTISVLIGVVSGFVPAYGASQLDPVEAIRANG